MKAVPDGGAAFVTAACVRVTTTVAEQTHTYYFVAVGCMTLIMVLDFTRRDRTFVPRENCHHRSGLVP